MYDHDSRGFNTIFVSLVATAMLLGQFARVHGSLVDHGTIVHHLAVLWPFECYLKLSSSQSIHIGFDNMVVLESIVSIN